MAVDSTTVLYSLDGPVAHIVLNRPEVINSYNLRMRDELVQALEAVRDDPDVRAAVVRGAGDRGFCAGADLTEFGTAPSQIIARSVRWERDLWGLFLSIKKPLVAALHGHVIGSGVEIACLCDVRIASEDAAFSMPEVALGMIPAAGGTQTLPRLLGVGRALEALLTGQRVEAHDALRLGLVHEVVGDGALLERAAYVVRGFAGLPPEVAAGIKTVILDGMDLPLDRGLELEERVVTQVMRR